MRKYAANVSDLLKRLDYSADYGGRFMSKMEVPVVFAMDENQLTAMVRGVLIDAVFNTLRTSERTRAARIANEHILPKLHHFGSAFAGTDVQRFALAVSYGHRDFSQERERPKGETLIVVVDRDTVNQFSETKITDQQVLDAADIFLYAGSVGLKKVSLKLE